MDSIKESDGRGNNRGGHMYDTGEIDAVDASSLSAAPDSSTDANAEAAAAAAAWIMAEDAADADLALSEDAASTFPAAEARSFFTALRTSRPVPAAPSPHSPVVAAPSAAAAVPAHRFFCGDPAVRRGGDLNGGSGSGNGGGVSPVIVLVNGGSGGGVCSNCGYVRDLAFHIFLNEISPGVHALDLHLFNFLNPDGISL